MGEQAELIINGDVCEGCGEEMGDGPGYPRRCSACGGKDEEDYSDMDWADNGRKERRASLEPGRKEYAFKQLEKIPGVKSTIAGGGDQIVIEFSGKRIDFWPFTGWFCGRKPIGNIKGRGIANLIKEIKKCLQ